MFFLRRETPFPFSSTFTQYVSVSSLLISIIWSSLLQVLFFSFFLILGAGTGVMIKHKFQQEFRVPFSKCQSKGIHYIWIFESQRWKEPQLTSSTIPVIIQIRNPSPKDVDRFAQGDTDWKKIQTKARIICSHLHLLTIWPPLFRFGGFFVSFFTICPDEFLDLRTPTPGYWWQKKPTGMREEAKFRAGCLLLVSLKLQISDLSRWLPQPW